MRKPIKCTDCGGKIIPEWEPCEGEWRCPDCYAEAPDWYSADPDRHTAASAEWCQ